LLTKELEFVFPVVANVGIAETETLLNEGILAFSTSCSS
jgi:hypothetical protein